jgi:hypothetical protein
MQAKSIIDYLTSSGSQHLRHLYLNGNWITQLHNLIESASVWVTNMINLFDRSIIYILSDLSINIDNTRSVESERLDYSHGESV